MIRVAQLYTGGVGSEIVRRLDGHPLLELVAVLVHSEDKAGVDSGELVGAAPNGITTTLDIDEVIATQPDAAIYSGMLWDHEMIGRLLAAGINVYTGMGGYYLPGQPEYDALQAAGIAGGASLAAGGNIPGLISDVFPLFLSGYTANISHIRAWQRNHVETYPSAAQLEQGLGIGLPPGSTGNEEVVDGGWVWAMRQSANMIATALGFECTDLRLTDKQIALAPEDVVLPVSGLKIAQGTVAGREWTFSGFAGDHEFLTITNEQSARARARPGLAREPRRTAVAGRDHRHPTDRRDDRLARRRRAGNRERAPQRVARDERRSRPRPTYARSWTGWRPISRPFARSCARGARSEDASIFSPRSSTARSTPCAPRRTTFRSRRSASTSRPRSISSASRCRILE